MYEMVDFDQDMTTIPFENSNAYNISPTEMWKRGSDIIKQFEQMDEMTKKLNECETERTKCLELRGSCISYLPSTLQCFDWVTSLCLDDTSIRKLENVPPNVRSINIMNGSIDIIDGTIFPLSLLSLCVTESGVCNVIGLNDGIEEIILKSNRLKNICQIQQSVIYLDVSDNSDLQTLPDLTNNPKLKILHMNATGITNIDMLSDSIEKLESCRCVIKIVNKLPKSLAVWKSYVCEISLINCPFPEGMVEIDLFNNELKEIPILPKKVKTLDLCNNELIMFPEIVMDNQMEHIDVRQNPKISIDDIKKFMLTHTTIKVSYDDDSPPAYDDQMRDDMEDFWGLRLRRRSDRIIQKPRNDFNSEYSPSNPHYIILERVYRL